MAHISDFICFIFILKSLLKNLIFFIVFFTIIFILVNRFFKICFFFYLIFQFFIIVSNSYMSFLQISVYFLYNLFQFHQIFKTSRVHSMSMFSKSHNLYHPLKYPIIIKSHKVPPSNFGNFFPVAFDRIFLDFSRTRSGYLLLLFLSVYFKYLNISNSVVAMGENKIKCNTLTPRILVTKCYWTYVYMIL